MSEPLITQKQWNSKLRELRVAKELLRAAEATIEILEKGKTMKWRHIETAPHDGRQILTFGRHHDIAYASGKPWYQTSFWSEQHQLFVGWSEYCQPTHWKPLPKEPID